MLKRTQAPRHTRSLCLVKRSGRPEVFPSYVLFWTHFSNFGSQVFLQVSSRWCALQSFSHVDASRRHADVRSEILLVQTVRVLSQDALQPVWSFSTEQLLLHMDRPACCRSIVGEHLRSLSLTAAAWWVKAPIAARQIKATVKYERSLRIIVFQFERMWKWAARFAAPRTRVRVLIRRRLRRKTDKSDGSFAHEAPMRWRARVRREKPHQRRREGIRVERTAICARKLRSSWEQTEGTNANSLAAVVSPLKVTGKMAERIQAP